MTACIDYIHTLCTILSPLINVVGVVGNILVIVVIIKSKDMLNSTNIFLVNLAVADLMVLLVWGNSSLLVCVNSELDIHMPRIPGGHMCKAMFFFEVMVSQASVITILAIGFERYYAVCKPLNARYICTKKRAYWICILSWAFAVLFSSPCLFRLYCKLKIPLHAAHYKRTCLVGVDSFLKSAYVVACALLFFFLPLVILAGVFSLITRHLKGAVTSTASMGVKRRRRPVIKMLATVILVFFVCHLPRRVMHLLILLPPEFQLKLDEKGIIHSTMFCETLIFLHSAVNPILYNMMSARFRSGLKQLYYDLVQVCHRWRKSWCLLKNHTDKNITPSALEHKV